MYNLTTVDTVNNKFALLNSGDYLMDIDQVKEIIEAGRTYIKNWTQEEINLYNDNLLAEREKDRKDSSKYRLRLAQQKREREERRFVYIMLNKRNGLYKIGVSINTIKRERTLQAEEPEIEIIETFKGGFVLERVIHNYFANKRVRGEWFKLDTEDIEKLKSRLATNE